MNIEKEVKLIVAEILHISEDCVTSTLSVGDIDEWDSMGNMAIIAALEDRMGVEFPMEELFELTSVEAFIDMIKKIKE